jgi:hypothetical protein
MAAAVGLADVLAAPVQAVTSGSGLRGIRQLPIQPAGQGPLGGDVTSGPHGAPLTWVAATCRAHCGRSPIPASAIARGIAFSS